jgi:hypothetical protein
MILGVFWGLIWGEIWEEICSMCIQNRKLLNQGKIEKSRTLSARIILLSCDASYVQICTCSKDIPTSVSNPVYTDTGIPVFGTPNTDTDKNLPVFAGIENVKMGTFQENYFLLNKIKGHIRLIYFVFTCKLAKKLQE